MQTQANPGFLERFFKLREKNTTVKEQQNNEETVTGRRRAQRQTETEVVEQAQHGFDPQNVADIYRLSQKPEK